MPPANRSELANAILKCRNAFIGIGAASGALNVLMLTGSFYMLEIYDRVIPSRSAATLIGLSILALTLYAFHGALDLVRSRLLVRTAASLDEGLGRRLYDTIVRLPLTARTESDGLQPLRDLDQIRSFMSGAGPLALFDLPWMPLYLGICYLFHPWIGLTATIGGLILVTITLLIEILTRKPIKTAVILAMQRNGLAEASRRNAEVIQAMGMAGQLGTLWEDANRKHMASQRIAADVAGGLGAISKVLRLALQSTVLGVGAYLVIEQQATAGIIIAGSILTARALAPIEIAIGNWRGLVAARQSWSRLHALLNRNPIPAQRMALPRPTKSLSVETVAVIPPGGRNVVVQDATFRLTSGQGLGIVGPSAAGKSSLARTLVGAWQPAMGKVRLDEAAIEQWSTPALGRFVGYLPQDIELFDGTIAQNITRFESEPNPENVIAAATAADVNQLIARLPDGYETRIGVQGAALSGGQRQRIALARALYGDPFLVVLDEPNSNLDSEGEAALARAIKGVRERGGIVVVVTHSYNVLSAVDLLLVMGEGKVLAFGPRDQLMSKLAARRPADASPRSAALHDAPAPRPAPLRVVETQEATS
jgi:PrtD family type I secretion system ABC transporter